MIKFLKKRLSYANVAMTLALVFAMTGGAYAASKYVITSTKQISPKVLKSLKGSNGKSGANGATGAAGAAGPAGATGPGGPQGPAGAAGTNGTNGTNGEKGKDGKDGKEGKEGALGTAGTTLPKGATETGQWVITQWHKAAGEFVAEAISFPIPLAQELDVPHVHLVGANVTGTAGCAGGSVTEPKAESGNLCVYEQEGNNLPADFAFSAGASTFGALIGGQVGGEGEVVAVGSWAVTG
jgi:hypothetical protein